MSAPCSRTRRRRLHEHVALLGEPDGEGVDDALARPRSRHRWEIDQCPGLTGDAGARGRHIGGCSTGSPRRFVGHVRRGEEAPSRTDEGAHSDTGVLVLGDALDLAVARGHRFVPTLHHAGVGVPSAGIHGRLDGGRRHIEL